MKSFVRICHKARKPKSPQHKAAVSEFIRKMGGPWAVIQAITEAREPSLFDPEDEILATKNQEEDANRVL